jgi:uncharacterized protein (DUF4213/DUF364 family)
MREERLGMEFEDRERQIELGKEIGRMASYGDHRVLDATTLEGIAGVAYEMKILDDIIAFLPEDSKGIKVREVRTCTCWTAVVSRECGLASTFLDRYVPRRKVKGVGQLTQMTALELAEYAKSDILQEAAIGMAAINSLIEFDESKCREENAFAILAKKGEGKRIAVIGYYPWVPRLRKIAKELWVLDTKPQVRDLPPQAAPEIIPEADVVAVTGTSFINHTVEALLNLCKDKFVIMLGPTSPMSAVLFDYGVDVIAGVKVVDTEKVLRTISEGAMLPQVAGIKFLTMRK